MADTETPGFGLTRSTGTLPPAAAVAHGHALEWDPPFGITAAWRWTCSICHRTAIRYGPNEYGSAVNEPCSPAAAAEEPAS